MCEKNILALIFLGVIIPLCGLGGAAEVAQRNVAANENAGFINIDCGATAEYLDRTRQIWYQNDSAYINSGENMDVSPEFMNSNIQLMGKNLRSFPYGMRNCYTLKPRKSENQTYLIRASFLYGNYDRKNQIPIFDLHIGVNKWATIQLQNVSSFTHYEIDIAPPKGDVHVCLINTGHGNPFINGLELRILKNALYQPGPGALRNWWRLNLGSNLQSVRHPDDDYDRIWERMALDRFPNWLPISNKSSFNTVGTNDFYKVPDKVLMTAVRSPNTSIPLSSYTDVVDAATTTWHMYFHFVEIHQLENGQKRKLKVSVNDRTTKAITLEYAKPMTLSLPLYGAAVNFSIYAVEGSTLPPIFNAIELFKVIDLPIVPTLLDDVEAITRIKQTYVVPKDWQGDPCVPNNFAWESINCNYKNPPRIISLNLSSCDLTGEISTTFSKLDGIQTLDLSYNRLSGPLPEFLGELPNLKILYLMGNNLTGLIPSSLKNKFQDGALVLRLAGNPLCQTDHCEENKENTKRRTIAPLVASILSAAVVLAIICALLYLWRIRRRKDAIKNLHNQDLIKSRNRPFKYNEVLQITGNLKTVIGEGGFGKVYLGDLMNGIKVAVKLLSETSIQGYKEFQAEAQLLMIVHHKNLVSLIGYCHDGGNMALIYEYMVNGNLRHHLLAAKVLSWSQRLQIAVDAAQGLEYLHNGCKPPIVHRDLKPSNILLDGNMQAKIADFGLSRTFQTESATHITTQIAGTIGYVDPEFQASGNMSKASDVYSFGIILFELITGHPAVIRAFEKSISIVDWVNPLINGGDIRKVVDPNLHGEFGISSAWKAVEIAMSCTLIPGIQRPDMSIVLADLKQCLAIQMGSENLHAFRDDSTYSSFIGGRVGLDHESLSLVSAR